MVIDNLTIAMSVVSVALIVAIIIIPMIDKCRIKKMLGQTCEEK